MRLYIEASHCIGTSMGSSVVDESLRNQSLESSLRNVPFSEEKDVRVTREVGCLSIIVLGASGDLAKKKTFPALFHLFNQGFLQENDVHIFGYARTKLSDDELRERIHGSLVQHLKSLKRSR
ncbi:glucose-6-phosphate 1-dehydrogenase, cytoplasmic isoform-like [Curcuma longa]|uniref:glucose-6-phosphate 1-dehydrogenase, cytoplasmic isoform-like n=1 Tax=Curcuma longa TaxID=136217 RepID=UPI003D9F62F8